MTPREHLTRRLERLDAPQVRALVRFIREGEVGRPMPCWGAIAERCRQGLGDVTARLQVWRTLLEAGDRRAQWLFVDLHRDHLEVLARVLDEPEVIPASVQRALIALEAAAPLVEARLERLDAQARQLWRAGGEALRRERQLFDSRIGALMTLRFFIPTPDVSPEPGPVSPAPPGPTSAAPRS